MAAQRCRRLRAPRPHRDVSRERGPAPPGLRFRSGGQRGARGRPQRGNPSRRSDSPALPASGVDVPGRGDELRAQALRVALERAEQGLEPQQLHRPHGGQLSGGACSVRARARLLHPERGGSRGSRPRLHPHARRRQPPTPRVLLSPRPRARTERAPPRGDRPDPLQRLPGSGYDASSGSPARRRTCNTSCTRASLITRPPSGSAQTR